MRKLAIGLLFSAVAIAAVVTIATAQGLGPDAGKASSHREAPLIADDPAADNTDVYAFVSPDRPDKRHDRRQLHPAGGAGGRPELRASSATTSSTSPRRQRRRRDVRTSPTSSGSRRRSANPNTFLYNTGQITSLDDADWNVRQMYSVTRVIDRDGPSACEVLGRNLPTPPVNIGPRSTPNYEALATAAVTDLPGGIKVFAGQRDDPFFVDLGSVFDLAGLRPFNPLHVIPLPTMRASTAWRATTSTRSRSRCRRAQLTTFDRPIVGVYASASRQRLTVLRTGHA